MLRVFFYKPVESENDNRDKVESLIKSLGLADKAERDQVKTLIMANLHNNVSVFQIVISGDVLQAVYSQHHYFQNPPLPPAPEGLQLIRPLYEESDYKLARAFLP